MPVEATIALSHQEGISDSARARELYKYVLAELGEAAHKSASQELTKLLADTTNQMRLSMQTLASLLLLLSLHR